MGSIHRRVADRIRLLPGRELPKAPGLDRSARPEAGSGSPADIMPAESSNTACGPGPVGRLKAGGRNPVTPAHACKPRPLKDPHSDASPATTHLPMTAHLQRAAGVGAQPKALQETILSANSCKPERAASPPSARCPHALITGLSGRSSARMATRKVGIPIRRSGLFGGK